MTQQAEKVRPASGAPAVPGRRPLPRRHSLIRRFAKNRLSAAAAVYLIVLIVLAVLAPVIAPYDPNVVDVSSRFAPFGAAHWLGADELGRDQLSRLLVGSGVSLLASVEVVAIGVGIGVPLGMLAASRARALDTVLSRSMDALMSIPALIFAMIFVAVLGSGLGYSMLAIGIIAIPRFYRVSRAVTKSVRSETYIEASEALGGSAIRTAIRHVLPNALPPLIVQICVVLGTAVIAEAALSFLGLGIVPPTASWGSMLRGAYASVYLAPQLVYAPGLMITLTVLSCTLVGDGLRKALSTDAARPRSAARVTGRGVARRMPSAGKALQGALPATSSSGEPRPLLSVRDLSVSFRLDDRWTPVIQDVSFDVSGGESVALVGESGSGKSVTSLACLGLTAAQGGRIGTGSVVFDGADLTTLPERRLRQIRGNDIGVIFQQPMRSLNPAFTVGEQIAEIVRAHQRVSRKLAWRRAVDMLDRVQIPRASTRAGEYPHTFSGGMCQRVMIAMALACEPRLLIADEPTTALDVTVQAQILRLLDDIRRDSGISVLFVTHDLGVVAEIADRVVVMYAGQVVETGSASATFVGPQHPYTSGLLQAIPRPGGARRLVAIPGYVPRPGMSPDGCRFRPRCAHGVVGVCDGEAPEPARTVHGTVRCARAAELELAGVRLP